MQELLKNAIPAQSKEIEIDFLLGKPSQIALFNQTLIIADNMEEKLLTFYDIRENRFLGRQVQVGQGPNEVIPPILLSRTSESNNLSILQRQSGKYLVYNIDSILNGDLKPSNSLDLGIADRITQTGDGFITTGPYDEGSIRIFDNKGNIVKNQNIYPQYIKELNERESQYVFAQGHIAYNKEHKVLAFASYFLGDLAFYKLNEDSLQQLKKLDFSLSNTLRNRITNSNEVGQIMDTDLEYFSDIYATTNYFYLLYTGISRKDKNSISKSYIFKFSAEGELMTTYKTDRKIISFCAKNDDKKGYALALSQDMDYILVEIDL